MLLRVGTSRLLPLGPRRVACLCARLPCPRRLRDSGLRFPLGREIEGERELELSNLGVVASGGLYLARETADVNGLAVASHLRVPAVVARVVVHTDELAARAGEFQARVVVHDPKLREIHLARRSGIYDL